MGTAAGTAAAAAPAPRTAAERLAARRSPRQAGEPGVEVPGLGRADADLLTDLLHAARTHGLPAGLGPVRLRRVLVDRTGQPLAADGRTRPIPASGSSQQPGSLLRDLLTSLPPPPPRTHGYRPTAAQQRVLDRRDRTCTFPGCGRPAARSQLDHLDPWRPDGTGGPTSTANLHCLCQHHHRLKHDGWHPTRHPDGTTHWTSPRGLEHVRRPA